MRDSIKADAKPDTASTVDGSSGNFVENPYIKVGDWGWAINPVELRYALMS